MTEFQQKIKKNDVKIRCNVCNKKINMTFIECKCGNFYVCDIDTLKIMIVNLIIRQHGQKNYAMIIQSS